MFIQTDYSLKPDQQVLKPVKSFTVLTLDLGFMAVFFDFRLCWSWESDGSGVHDEWSCCWQRSCAHSGADHGSCTILLLPLQGVLSDSSLHPYHSLQYFMEYRLFSTSPENTWTCGLFSSQTINKRSFLSLHSWWITAKTH